MVEIGCFFFIKFEGGEIGPGERQTFIRKTEQYVFRITYIFVGTEFLLFSTSVSMDSFMPD